MISTRQLIRDPWPSSTSSAFLSLPGDDVLSSRHPQPYRASTQPQGMRPPEPGTLPGDDAVATRAPASQAQDCGHPGPGSGLAARPPSGFTSDRSFVATRLNQLHLDHPTPAQPSNASATAQAHDRMATTSFVPSSYPRRLNHFSGDCGKIDFLSAFQALHCVNPDSGSALEHEVM